MLIKTKARRRSPRLNLRLPMLRRPRLSKRLRLVAVLWTAWIAFYVGVFWRPDWLSVPSGLHILFRAVGLFASSYDIQPTSVRCTDVSNSSIPDTIRTCEYRNLYLHNGDFVAVMMPGEEGQVQTVWKTSKVAETYRPKVREYGAPLASEVVRAGGLGQYWGVHVWFGEPWTNNIGHALWDGLYAAWVAYLTMGLDPKAQFTLIADQYYHLYSTRDAQAADFIFRKFGGHDKYLRWGDMVDWKGWYRFDTVIMGIGAKGQRWMTPDQRLPGTELGSVAKFRDRMYRVYGVGRPRKWTKRPRRDIRAIIVHNKRYNEVERREIDKVVALARSQHYNLKYIDWADIGSKPNNMKQHLEVLRDTDVYISGPGTGMMYAGFMPDQAVFVALGELVRQPDGSVIRWMEQYILEGSPFLRAIYYPTRLRTSGLHALVLTSLFDTAVDLVADGFSTSAEPGINLSVEGRLFVRTCKSHPGPCQAVLDGMNGLKYGPLTEDMKDPCAHNGWVEFLVYEFYLRRDGEPESQTLPPECVPTEFRDALREEYQKEQRASRALADPCKGSNCSQLLQYHLAP
jgi:hypothetical protein